MQGLLWIISLVFLWVMIIILFSKTNMNFFKFLLGSVGFFTLGMILFLPYCQVYLNKMIANTLYVISVYTNYFKVYKADCVVSATTKTGIISILIDYECSGIIEMLVFTSLSIFFPFGGFIRKVTLTLIGNIYIFVTNIIRIIFIVFMTKSFGVEIYYLAHTLFARILFFGFMLLLYYSVFTKTHLKYQKVGDL
jgi:exosortase family protein XrtG